MKKLFQFDPAVPFNISLRNLDPGVTYTIRIVTTAGNSNSIPETRTFTYSKLS